MKAGSERFHEILKEIGHLHDKKQKDYGSNEDPFANVRATESWGIPAWVGATIRLGDKVQRLKSMWRNGYLANESVEDSLRDIAVYAIIALVLWEETQAEKLEPVPLGRDGWPVDEAVAKAIDEQLDSYGLTWKETIEALLSLSDDELAVAEAYARALSVL